MKVVGAVIAASSALVRTLSGRGRRNRSIACMSDATVLAFSGRQLGTDGRQRAAVRCLAQFAQGGGESRQRSTCGYLYPAEVLREKGVLRPLAGGFADLGACSEPCGVQRGHFRPQGDR